MSLSIDRNSTIDVLRVIGTLFVILAHVNIPPVLSTVRSFDVCLLVIISGYIFSQTYRPNLNYGKYVLKRFKRLCIPAYITASIIFLTCLGLCLVAKRAYPYSGIEIAETYLFIGGRTGGIGYFWIIRIYLLMALMAPALKLLDKIIKSDLIAILVPVAALLISQALYVFTWGKLGSTYDMVLENFIMSSLAYGSVYFTGIRLQTNKKFKFIAISAFGIATVALIIYFAISGNSYVVSDYKYPAQAEYIVISTFASLIVWEIVDAIFKKMRSPNVIAWLSKQSFNMYLIHIFILFVMSWGSKIISKIPLLDLWFVKYAVILICCIFAIKVYELLVNVLKRKKQV